MKASVSKGGPKSKQGATAPNFGALFNGYQLFICLIRLPDNTQSFALVRTNWSSEAQSRSRSKSRSTNV